MKPALIRLHITVFLWGFTGVLGRLISLNEGWLVWWRLSLTVLILWAYFFCRKKITRIRWKDFLKIGGIGTILALHWVLFYGSIKYSNVSIALTCLATSGMLSALLEPLFFKTKLNFIELLLGTFALAGIVIIYFSNLQFSIGIYIGLLAAIASVVASILNKKIVSGYTPQVLTLYQLTGGFIGLTILMPVYDLLLDAHPVFPAPLDWLWFLILAGVCTVLTYILYLSALKHLSAFTMNLTITLEPVYGILLAFLIFHENKYLSDYFYIGFSLILLAVLLQTLRVVKQKEIVVPFE